MPIVIVLEFRIFVVKWSAFSAAVVTQKRVGQQLRLCSFVFGAVFVLTLFQRERQEFFDMSSFGGGGRGRGRHNNYGNRGGRNSGRNNRQHRGGAPPLEGRVKPCTNYLKGNCTHGSRCTFAHIIKLHAKLDAASPLPNNHHNNSNGFGTNFNNFGNNYNNNSHNNNKAAPVSSVAIWETQGAIKIFTASHDGYWRLWNTQGSSFQKEFEHNMGGGRVECVEVASNFLFCGFEAVSSSLPGDAMVGMIHAWNLARPTDPPLEFRMHALIPYAHASCVSALAVVGGDKIVSGCQSGVIRLWNYDASSNGGKGGFSMKQTIHGHAREVTGLVVVENLLWSSSVDGSIRLWDMSKGGDCQYVITRDTQSNGNSIGHTAAVTGLLSVQMPNAGTFVLSSSLDGHVKAWNGANGECVASENHNDGVVSMTLAKDTKNNPILLLGLEHGNIMCRNLVQTAKTPAFCLLFVLTARFTAGHHGAVRAIQSGPQGTFYTVGEDGQLMVFQITGELGI